MSNDTCAACQGQGIGQAEYDPRSGVVDHPFCRMCAGSGIRVSDRDAAVAMAAYQRAPGNNPLDCMRAALSADRVATRRADARSTGDDAESIHRLRAAHGEFLTACADPFVHDRLTYARRVVDAVPDALTAYIDRRGLHEETMADLLECQAELGRLRAEVAAMRAVVDAARELVSWDWINRVDGAQVDDVRADVVRLEAALSTLAPTRSRNDR